MKKTLITCAACAALLLAFGPGASAAPGDHGDGGASDAAKSCAALKKADHAAFKAVWGKHAMRDCIRANRDEDATPGEAAEEFSNAARDCRDERAADPAGFQATYGTNGADHGGTNGDARNAFGKCVSTHVKDDGDDEDETLDA